MADKVIETQDRMVRGADLLDRKAGEPPIKGEENSLHGIHGRRPKAPEVRLTEIGQAIEKARALPPDGGARCDDCWRRGRDAALKLIETEPAD